MSGTAVLLSGGLDSAVLLADEAARGDVQPIYVSVGLAWEAAERAMVSQFLAEARFRGRVRPLVSLSVDMRDVYAATHWAVEGRPPAYHTPDEDVYLPGRNIVLLGKAGVYCAAAKLDRLVLGTLAHNPFPDATPDFRAAMARALSLGLAHDLRNRRPLRRLEQGGSHQARHRARPAARAHAVVHASGIRDSGFGLRVAALCHPIRIPTPRIPSPLRPVQQMPRAPRRLSRARAGRPHGL